MGHPFAMFASLLGLWKDELLRSGLKASITWSWSSNMNVTSCLNGQLARRTVRAWQQSSQRCVSFAPYLSTQIDARAHLVNISASEKARARKGRLQAANRWNYNSNYNYGCIQLRLWRLKVLAKDKTKGITMNSNRHLTEGKKIS